MVEPYRVKVVESLPRVSPASRRAALVAAGYNTFALDAGNAGNRFFSYASMVIPSNDAFIASADPTAHAVFDELGNFVGGSFVVYGSRVRDAGTEVNDESCANIPGPYCMGAPYSPEDGEGFVHVANGIQGIGDLPPEMFDWRNPVASVSIRRMK